MDFALPYVWEKPTVFSGQSQSSTSANVNDLLEPQPFTKKTRPARKHEPLKSYHSIRLLALYPASNTNDQISCTLTVHDFDEAIPNFTALSYTWGSNIGTKTILVNRFRTSITHNLHAALTHLRDIERPLILWVDALCINQKDKIERSSQVSLMRDIYMVADDVVAFLGPATPGLDPNDKTGVYVDIVSRPYWDRLWIIQEFVLGKNVKLQRGHLRLDWDYFDGEFPEHARTGGDKMLRLFDFRRRYRATNNGVDIAEAIEFALDSQASDPRDKVYGVMGLVRLSPTGAVRPNYTFSVCQVYRQAVYHMGPHYSAPFSPVASEPGEDVCAQSCDGQACGSFKALFANLPFTTR